MTGPNRRTLLSSIAASILFAAGSAQALTCDVRRSRQDGISTKSYTCRLGAGRSVTVTFIRMSDVVADRIARGQLPGGYDAITAGSRLIETPASVLLEDLLRQHSFAFERSVMEVTFDGRQEGLQASSANFPVQRTRFRTLGVWDDPNPDKLPFFPLPDELRRALAAPGEFDASGFLRSATRQDFDRLPEKMEEYTRLWREQAGALGAAARIDDLGNLDLMAHLDAGRVEGFLPLYFWPLFQDGCTGEIYGGAHFVPPALYVDAMLCRNTGTELLRIDDFFGADDRTTLLRPYSSATPPGERAFGWRPFELMPGESVVAVQRLLFGATDQYDPQTESARSFTRAVYGPTQLPKGIVMAGESLPFEGRSHNALIVASYNAKGSCPYLSSWCDDAQEWVRLGKVLTECDAPEREGDEFRDFHDLRTRFKLIEREHERTVLRAATLEIETRDGTVVHLSTPDSVVPKAAGLPLTLDIGQMVEFAFAPPEHLCPSDVVRTRLRLRGHYRTYVQADFERCRQKVRREGLHLDDVSLSSA